MEQADHGNHRTERGLGLAASVAEDVIQQAAAAVQKNGYDSFWLNNPPKANGLELLGKVAINIQGLWLGVGVIPLSHDAPDTIVRQVTAHRIPLERFYLGVGSGAGSGGLERVQQGIRAIRAALGCSIVVAALGPKMCRLAGAEADGVLLNWLTPGHARKSIAWIEEAAAQAKRPVPRLMAYVRVALGDAAIDRLRAEAGNYEAIPHYAAHFQRMGVTAAGTAVCGSEPPAIRQGLKEWDGIVDEVVVRAITAGDAREDVERLVEAAAPPL